MIFNTSYPRLKCHYNAAYLYYHQSNTPCRKTRSRTGSNAMRRVCVRWCVRRL